MQTSTQSPAEIQASLDKPGAGIGWKAMLYNRLVFKPFTVRKVSWEESETRFRAAHEKVSKELRSFALEKLTERVLVPPQVGLEDSSRYWSAAMTARHLVIVGRGVEYAVIELSHGRKVAERADIAKMKPEDARNAASALDEYFQFMDGAITRINAAVGDRGSRTTHHHPWFGAMRAKDWFWLLGAHSFIHLTQLRNIKKGLAP